MAAEEPALTRPVDPDDIGKYAKFDGTDVVWDTPAGGGGVGTPGLVGDLSAIEIGDAATAGATGRYADAAHQHALAAPAAPAALGASAATGAATMPARADHVHPYPTAAQVGAATTAHAHAGVYDPAGTAAAAVAAHDADTSVHGIPDTSALLDTGDIGVSVQGYSAVLAATTASFTTADEAKLDGIEASADVTDETNVVAALSGAPLTDVGTPASGDKILLLDASDSDNLKTAAFSEFGGGGGSADGSSSQTVAYTRSGGYYTTIGGNYASFSSASHGAGDTRFAPFELSTAAAVTFDRIGIDIVSGTGGALVRLGIYNVGPDGKPGTVELDAGTVAADSAGQKEITISHSLAPGRYYIVAAAQVATTNLRAYGTGLVRSNWHGYASAANAANKDKHTLVATGITGAFASTPTVNDGDVHPVVWLRAA